MNIARGNGSAAGWESTAHAGSGRAGRVVGGQLPVSVVIPAYNRAGMLKRSLASVAAQRRVPAEVIVVDDGSEDETCAVAEAFGARVLRHAENKGLSAARNTGLRAAAHAWVALLDSDDEWLPHHLEHVWRLRGEHALVAGSALNCGPDPAEDRFCGPVTEAPVVLSRGTQLIFPGNTVPVSAVMLRRDMALELGGFRPHRGVVEDFDMWLRLLEHGTAICSPTVSVVYHLHGEQMSRRDAHTMQLAHREASEAHLRRVGGSSTPLVRWEGVAGWDNLRRALDHGRPLTAARCWFYIAIRPQRAVGMLWIWGRRLLVRRRSARLRRAGIGPSSRAVSPCTVESGRVTPSDESSPSHSPLLGRDGDPEGTSPPPVRTGDDLMSSVQLIDQPSAPIIGQSTNGHAPEPDSEPETAGGALIRALSRRRLLVLLCTLVLAGAGAGLGIVRAPIYTSAATLQVGKVNPNSPGFYGFVQSATDLATAFSRSITATAVLDAVQGRLRIAPEQSLARLSAEPIPNSPIFRVIATGPTARQAIGLANVASAAVVTYVNEVSANDPGSSRTLLHSFRSASLQLARSKADAEVAAHSFKLHPSRATSAGLINAQAVVASEKLRTQTIASGYQQNAQGTTPANLVSLLAGASSASNDRAAKIELYGFTGLLAGLVLGCIAAAVLERRKSTPIPV
jgi:GT2 family glycosyltransferase